MRFSVRAGLIALLLAPLLAVAAAATEESEGTVIVRARNGAAPVPSAEVSADGLQARTDERGEANLSLPAGEHAITVSRPGFAYATLQVTVRAGAETTVTVQLQEVRLETEVVVVSATRSGRMVEDQPIRVEAVPREEIEENLTIAPGNLSTLLNELGGLRVQTTSPALGGASLRLQGLRGRYTQILLDELPLYGEQPDDFGLLQTPPLDLAQVEVIKGTSSALYGGTALGGLINLVSRLPGSEPELLVNQTSHGGTDAVGFLSHKLGGAWGYTLLGGAHHQRREDVNGDGWADVPGYWRTELRPRFFWNDEAGRSLFVTVGTTVEDRKGGTLDGATTPAGTPFCERLHTRRLDGGMVGRFLLPSERLFTLRASSSGTWHDRGVGDDINRDLRGFALGEATLSGTQRGHTWVAGAALQRDWYRSRDLPSFDFTRLVPALFAQDEYAVGAHLGLSASTRLDFDDEHGTFFSPLVSALVRPGGGWNVRLSAGTGYSAPVPFTEETEVVGLWRVLPLRDVKPERAKTSSLDVGWSTRRFEVNGTLFASEVSDPLVLRDSARQPGSFEIANAPRPTRTVGSEFLTRLTVGPMHMIATYTYVHSTEADPSGAARRDVPLTPRHAGELAWIWEEESRGRVGVEVSYTGGQSLEHDPYRETSPSYIELNALAELRIGETRIFVNAVNLTDVRQTRFDPLVLPARAADGRWATDVWAPLEGRVFNAGVRIEF
jgi:outer membrane receptor for ferrienterochelin and colicins